MKKTVIAATLAAFLLISGQNASNADEATAQKQPCPQNCACRHERPKLYDKSGNELKAPPKPGDKVYDKNGNEIKPPRHMRGPELNLTAAQKAKADKIREASKAEMKPIFEKMKSLYAERNTISRNGKMLQRLKDEKIAEIDLQISDLRKKADKIRKNDMAKFEKILTKDQKKIIEEFKKTHKRPKCRPCRPGYPGQINPPVPSEQSK